MESYIQIFRCVFSGGVFTPIPPGPNGEHHHALVSVDGSTNVSMKIPHLRNLYERVGFEVSLSENLAGFGFLHDGSVDSIAQFVSEPVFSLASDQEVADMVRRSKEGVPPNVAEEPFVVPRRPVGQR